MPHLESPGARRRRRLRTVPALFLAAIVLTLSIPVWLPLAVVADLVRARVRLPMARLLAFGVCWTWIETAGVVAAGALWTIGRSRHHGAHYALMRWWAGTMMRALALTTGARPRLEGLDAIEPGNAIVLSRHVSLADSLLSAWAVCVEGRLRPRYVLKRELLYDPSLDIVGMRIPNHFLDRSADDPDAELQALRELSAGVGPGIAAVIFPEGTRANDDKRRRALAKIAETDPDRAERLAGLRRLLPPRAGGARALVEGAPDADVVLAWHTGFDGLDSFSGILRRLAAPLPPVRFVAERVPAADVPRGDAFTGWLDEQWLRMDAEVDAALAQRP